ncbi:hypothetical protein Q5P01_010535 [Channa striata]|uniref:Uncharacterized protein n=1 Tax=Channa striata TaxID=64152 RepID=A0AA88N0Y2_CHASR|nr:hypothetical protein Q5P01_010535 [Channa striata]
MHFENLAPEQIGTIAMPPRTEDTVEPRAGDGRERGSPAAKFGEAPVSFSRAVVGTRDLRQVVAFLFRDKEQIVLRKAHWPQRTQQAIVSREQFQKFGSLSLECQMLLYAVLSCHINWVDYNHKQILLQPERPGPLAPNLGGDLRHLWCLKNKTFCSSEGRFDEIDTELRDSSRADNAEIEAAEALIELKCASLYMDAVECNTPRSCYLEIGIHPPYHCWHEGWSDEDDGANGEDDKRWPEGREEGETGSDPMQGEATPSI